MNEILNIENLNKSFNGISLLKDVSFVVNKGSIVLITGENGSGKTTLFNLITGLEKPTKGKILFNGKNITNKSALHIFQSGIIRSYQQPRLFKNLLVWENLVLVTRDNMGKNFINLTFKSKSTRLFDALSDTFRFVLALKRLTQIGFQDLAYQRAGELSYGQQKLLSFYMITMELHQLVLLDEPFAGLNPKSIEQISKAILYLRRVSGFTFLIIEHNINKALAIADCHFEMKDGIIKTINDTLPHE